MSKVKTAILISGRGSNMKALLEACQKDGFPAQITLVLSNNPDAKGLETAEEAGVPTKVINHRDFDAREDFDAAIDACLGEHDISLVALAGFMRLLTPPFLSKWHDKVINIHPSLLPSFKGLNTHERVLASGVRFSGCTVHFVRADMDEGPCIVQAAVPVHGNDTAQTLAARVLEAEHRAYPLALRLFGENRLHVRNETVHIDEAAVPDEALLNPEEES